MSGVEGNSAELVERIRAGDGAAEEALVRRFKRGVAVILRRCGARPSEAEDLGQDTFRIAIAKIRGGDLRDPARLPGFVSSLARNLAVESGRREGRRSEGALTAAAEQAEPAGDPLHRLLESEQAALVRRLLGELGSERDREVLRRTYLAGDDRALICRDLGLTPLQLARVLFRARERYRVLYERATR
jgi:RNA polymerase sigma-70 factor (ECF subfamily)